jgi:hypothetical protein
MGQKKVNSAEKPKRQRANITICINKELYEQLEALRTNKIGSSEIIDDRSSVYEKILILGLQQHQEHKRKSELLDKLDISVLEALNLDDVDLSKINPELLKKRANPSRASP